MKKRLLLMLTILALLMCAFAISVSATYIYKDTEGNELFSYEVDSSSIITTYEGEFPKTDAQGNALTWYVTATTTENGNTIKTVASVLTLDENYATLIDGTYSYKTNVVHTKNIVSVSFPNDAGITTLNLADGGYKNKNNWDPTGTEILFVYLPSTLTTLPERIVQGSKALVCEMPSEMPISKISHVAFYEAKCLREVNIPSSVTLIDGKSINDGTAFYNTTSLERVTFGSNDNLETIGTMAFYYSGLKYITLPDSVKTIGKQAFGYTQLVDSPFTEKSRLETIGGRAFGDISTLQTFIVPSTITSVEMLGISNYNDYGPLAESTIQLVTFGNADTTIPLAGGFFGRAKITNIVFADWITEIPSWYFVTATIDDITFGENVTTIGERVFQGATVKKIRLGAGFKYFVNSISDHQSFTHNANSVQEIYIPASFYAEAPEASYWVSYAFSCENSSNVKFFYTGTKEQLATSMANFIAQPNSDTYNGKFTGATQISWTEYSLSPESYASGNYIIYDYNACDAFYAGVHDERVEASYSNGYGSVGTKITGCVHKGCTRNTKEELPALFTSLGYSTSEDASTGISIRYRVNSEAIKAYKELTGIELSYGLFVTSKSVAESSDIFDTAGNAVNGAISLDVTSSGFAFVSLKMVGFDTENSKKTEFAIGMYAITVLDGKKTYSYLQEGTPVDGEKYAYIKYNDFVSTNS